MYSTSIKWPECGALPPSPPMPSWYAQLHLYFCLTAVNDIHFPFLCVLVPSVNHAVWTTALSDSEKPLQVMEASCSYPASRRSCWRRRTKIVFPDFVTECVTFISKGLKTFDMKIIIIIIIIIGIQPLGRSGQRPELSQSTGMALVRCILGRFLGVACHCFPPDMKIPC